MSATELKAAYLVTGSDRPKLERSTPRTREVHGLVDRLAHHVRRVQACQTLDARGYAPAMPPGS